jgi:hypothetical protein
MQTEEVLPRYKMVTEFNEKENIKVNIAERRGKNVISYIAKLWTCTQLN